MTWFIFPFSCVCLKRIVNNCIFVVPQVLAFSFTSIVKKLKNTHIDVFCWDNILPSVDLCQWQLWQVADLMSPEPAGNEACIVQNCSTLRLGIPPTKQNQGGSFQPKQGCHPRAIIFNYITKTKCPQNKKADIISILQPGVKHSKLQSLDSFKFEFNI